MLSTQRIKKFFSSFSKFFSSSQFNQRGFAPIIIPFAIVGVLGALTVAGLGGNKIAKDIAFAVYILIFNIIGTLTVLFAKLSAGILQWVISPKFTSLSYTNPAGNPIIKAGLGITQDLVNMILVLVLIYIAVATILRLAGHSTQKLLITFVAVALLVNFAPVIVGLIVDASNIVMNFFLKDLVAFTDLSETLGKSWRGMALMFKGQEEIDAAFFNSLTTAIFAFFLGLAFLLFAIVFVLRRIAIWILVILAPLAFVCYILPSTKKYWTAWWNQLIQWSIIGIAAGFFLNLSTILIAEAPKYIAAPTSQDLNSGMSTLLMSIVPLIFLYAGLTVGFQTSATGAGMVTSLITKGRGKFQTWAKTGGKRALGWAGASGRQLVPSKVKQWAFRQAAAGRPALSSKVAGAISGKWKGKAGKATGAIVGGIVGTAALPLWALRRGTGQIGVKALEAEKKEISEAEKNVTGKPVESVILKSRSPFTTQAQKIGYLNRLIKEGDLNEAIQKGLTDKEISNVLIQAKRYNADKDIESARPDLAKVYVTPTAGQTMGQALADQIIGKMKPARAGQIASNALSDPDVLEAIIRSWDGRHISKFVDTHGKNAVDAIENTIQRLSGSRDPRVMGQWLEDQVKGNNPRLRKYLSSSAGRNLMFNIR